MRCEGDDDELAQLAMEEGILGGRHIGSNKEQHFRGH